MSYIRRYSCGYYYIDKAGEPKGAVWGKAGSDPYHMEDYTHEDVTYITMDEMKELWKDLNFTLDNELSFYCGTGWRASIPFLIMYENGYTGEIIYATVGELSNDKAAK